MSKSKQELKLNFESTLLKLRQSSFSTYEIVAYVVAFAYSKSNFLP